MKIAFVLSKVDKARYDTADPPYPAGSLLLYSSSYMFASVTTFNSAVSVTRPPLPHTITEFNQNYFHLPDTRYAIYGLTSFKVPKGASTTCSTLLMNATLTNIDSYTVTSPNAPTNVVFKADIFTKNIKDLCKPASGADLANAVFTVGQKLQTISPDNHNEQRFQEDPAPTLTNPHSVTNAFQYQVWAAAVNSQTDTITMSLEMPFIGLTPSSGMKF